MAFAASLEENNGDVDGLDMTINSSVVDDTVFRVVSLVTAVYQSIDHMELRQDRGRGYYEREVALRFPTYDSESTETARAGSIDNTDSQGTGQNSRY